VQGSIRFLSENSLRKAILRELEKPALSDLIEITETTEKHRPLQLA
jgi:hypothetical protein